MIKLTLTGSIPSKKNSRQNFSRNGRLISIPNRTYYLWERGAIHELSLQKWEPITEYPVGLVIDIYVKDRVGRDIDNMLSSIMDVLKTDRRHGEIVRQGVIDDDDWKHVQTIAVSVKGVDKLNPRAEILIV